MSRGNQRWAIVRDDIDRLQRLDWLRRAVETKSWPLHAFVQTGIDRRVQSAFVAAEIITAAAEHFGRDPCGWTPGRRGDDVVRAVAAYGPPVPKEIQRQKKPGFLEKPGFWTPARCRTIGMGHT